MKPFAWKPSPNCIYRTAVWDSGLYWKEIYFFKGHIKQQKKSLYLSWAAVSKGPRNLFAGETETPALSLVINAYFLSYNRAVNGPSLWHTPPQPTSTHQIHTNTHSQRQKGTWQARARTSITGFSTIALYRQIKGISVRAVKPVTSLSFKKK